MRSITFGLLASLVLAGPVFAQSKAVAISGSESNAVSGSYAAGGSSTTVAQQGVYIDQRAPGQQTVISETRQSGTVRSEFAPAVNAPAFSSGHPCGLADSIGISIIGGGLTGGSTHVDDACLLAQMGEGRAAIAIIAGRNGTACRALRNNGRISGDSLCPGERREAGKVEPQAVAADRCEIKPGTTRTILTNATTNADRQACARSLGL